VSLVDYNRCGVPLIEIVTEPDLRSADEVEALIEAVRERLVYLGVSDCKMQEGSMRADVNLSLRRVGAAEYGTRTETKNMNSIKAIRRAIEFERGRQEALLESGGAVVQETRRWDDAAGANYAMRSKEDAQDYRYFPDPDLVPVEVSFAWIEDVRRGFPELAGARRERYVQELGLSAKTADVLTQAKGTADFFEALCAELVDAYGMDTKRAASEAANTVTGDMLRLLKESGRDAEKLDTSPKKIAAVLAMVVRKEINRNNGRLVIEAVYNDDVDPAAFVKAQGLAAETDGALMEETVRKVLAANEKSVGDLKAGKEKAFGFLVGQTMKTLGGKADPAEVNAELRKQLAGLGAIEAPAAPPAGGATGTAGGDGDGGKTGSAMTAGTLDTAGGADAAGTAGEAADVEEAGATEAEERERIGYSPAVPAWKKAAMAGGGKITPQENSLAQSGRYRDLTCGELSEAHVGKRLRLAGWVMAIRNHGGIVFVDLRDQYGVTQVVVDEGMLEKIGKEFSVSFFGAVVRRAEETVNPNIPTGTVELRAEEVEVLGTCRRELPFEIDASTDTREELRLQYRYLDLRNPKVRDNIVLRGEVIKTLRAEMEALGFTEVQTPILANSSPEGARDYLVPSRKHKGMFYALPQAPQQFKQLLMASGFDRYFQIAPCFRDEDARLDRSPGEFYQLDYEMAYATQEDVFAVAERVMYTVFTRFSDLAVSKPPFRRIPYMEAMLRYGSDKPDLRNPLYIIDLTEFFAGVDFAPFRGRPVRGIRVPGAAAQSRSWYKDMEKFALSVGMKGLGYITVEGDMSYKGPIDKFLSEEDKASLAELAELAPSDILYFISDARDAVDGLAGAIRTELGVRLGLIDEGRFEFCYIVDYPMYEYNEEEGRIDFTHNPFSMPQGEMEALVNRDPLDILAWQYDIVCNGVELSSGAVRNHRPDVMVKAFEIAGYTAAEVEQKFGALYAAFSYGAPPHAGMAPGVDRIVMLLAGEENIRETIAFPLNSNAANAMLGAPGEVSERQLREVHIRIR
jgi:aspartyl-tRNA synthetase